jgi:sporulation protein YabP
METVTKKTVNDIVKVPHKLVLENREKLSITGIGRVYNANEKTISIEVNGTNLVIEGANMQVSKLDVQSGNMEIIGIINEIKYTNSGLKNAKNFIDRIFK